MINDIEYTIKSLNKEKIIRQITEISEIKNVKFINNQLKFIVPRKNKKKVESILAKKEIEILNKDHQGIVGFLNKTILRLGVIIPIVIFMIFLFICNHFVFKYEIIGNELIPSGDVYEILEKNNIKGLLNKNKIDKTKIENEIMELDKVSFVSVIVKGNTLIINLKEKVFNSEYEEKDDFVPLKSGFNGIITEINVIQGTPLVKVGQTVKEGQELIAPFVIDTSGQKLSVKPMADIKADVFLTTITQVPNTKLEMVDTGNISSSKVMSLFGLNIFVKQEECNFKNYRTETNVIDMASNILLPIKISKTIYYEQKEVWHNNYFETNKEQILSDIQQKTRQLVNSCEIIKKEYKTITTGADINQITYTVVVNKSIC